MALVQCPDCNREISERASACPHCGAPNLVQQAVGSTTAAVKGGTTCPFSGHPIPPGATVCVCGAYYGYSNPRVSGRSVRLAAKLVVLAAFLFAIGYVLFHSSADDSTAENVALWLAILSLLPALVGIVGLVTSLPALLGGKGWWRSFDRT